MQRQRRQRCSGHRPVPLFACECASHGPAPSTPSLCACPQESQALQAKQRQLQAALAASQKEARAAAGLQEQLSSLASQLEVSQKEAAAASEQLTLAHSRSAVLEKAYAAAVEVSRDGGVGSVRGSWQERGVLQECGLHVCRLDCASATPTERCAALPPSRPQDSHALQTKQRQLQAALAQAQKEARAAAGQSDRLAALQAELQQAQEAADSAIQQVSLAQSRTMVVEKAYAAAMEVRGGAPAGGWAALRAACWTLAHLPWRFLVSRRAQWG